MALMTKAKFYYGPNVDTENVFLDFSEGGPQITAEVAAKLYSPSQLALALQNAMNELGTLTYSVIFNRSTRKITISASGNFSILIGTGTNSGSQLYDKLGFTGSIDLTGTNSYTADSVCGSEYIPQFYLLDFVPLENWIDAVDSATSTTGSGKVEFVTYGQQRRTQFSIELITNDKFLGDEIWSQDSNAIESVADFLTAAVQKGQIEFMRDKTDPASYELLLLEATESSQNGTGFKLVEQLDYGAGYFRTGLLRWREVKQ